MLAASSAPGTPAPAAENPDKKICKTIKMPASRLPGNKVCRTKAEWEAEWRESRKEAQDLVNRPFTPTTPD